MRAKRLWNRINAQILVWSGDEREQLRYDGKPILLPAHNETAQIGKGHPFRFESARDGKDRLIPGTLLVTDVVVDTPSGGVKKVFDVGEFCEFLERDKTHLFERGLEIVGKPDQVQAAMEAARPMWERSQDARAQQILSTEMERISKYEEKGQPAPEGSNAERVAWAISHLQQRRTADVARFGKDDLAAVLSGQFVKPKPQEVAEVEQLTAKQIMAQAHEVGLKLTKTELEGLIEGDDEQIEFVKEKIKGRKEASEATA